MKIIDIMNFAIKEGIKVDPRSKIVIDRILKERKEKYKNLKGIEKEVFDVFSLESPYEDSRIIWGDPGIQVNEAWVGIDIDTEDLLLVKKLTEGKKSKPVVIGHHPLGRSYANFYEVMDLQVDVLESMGMTVSIAENLTHSRKAEVARRVNPVNHFKEQDAARLLQMPTLNIHTPADNHVKNYLDNAVSKQKPEKLKDLLNLLLKIPEYKISAKKGVPPRIFVGSESNKCGKIFVDMTGGTEGSPELFKNLVQSGVSTVVAMHISDKHFKEAKEHNLNVVIAGHISSDNLGMNLLLDKLIKKLGNLKIIEFSGFNRVKRG